MHGVGCSARLLGRAPCSSHRDPGLPCIQAAPQAHLQTRQAGLIPTLPDDSAAGPSGHAVESGDAGAGGPAAEGHRPFPAFPSTAGAP